MDRYVVRWFASAMIYEPVLREEVYEAASEEDAIAYAVSRVPDIPGAATSGITVNKVWKSGE